MLTNLPLARGGSARHDRVMATALLWWWKIVIAFAVVANIGITINLISEGSWGAAYFAGLAVASILVARNTWRDRLRSPRLGENTEWRTNRPN